MQRTPLARPFRMTGTRALCIHMVYPWKVVTCPKIDVSGTPVPRTPRILSFMEKRSPVSSRKENRARPVIRHTRASPVRR